MLEAKDIDRLKGKKIHSRDLRTQVFLSLIRETGLGKKVKDAIGKEWVIPADELAAIRPERLMTVRNLGEKGIKNIRECLQKMLSE